MHVKTSSEPGMEVDHYNPTLKGNKYHAYGNLYPAISLCNNAKTDVWPKSAKKSRQRFLDPCKEQDYGEHIFEDSNTGELLTDTEEGIFHIENIDLNNEWLKEKRRERTGLRRSISTALIKDTAAESAEFKALFDQINRLVDEGIPPIPSMPSGRTPR
jgi:hypothetical protein